MTAAIEVRAESLAIEAGVFVAVVGPSGAGKDSVIDHARSVLAGDDRTHFVRRVITRLQQKETELMASERTRSAVARLDTPAFRKYQQTMIGVVEAQVSGGAADTARRAAVDDMLVRWRARIGN